MIKYGGSVALQYTRDVAQMFIRAAQAEYEGPITCNIQNDSVSVSDFIQILKQQFPGCSIDFDSSTTLPFPSELTDHNLGTLIGEIPHTPLPDAIQESSQLFRELVNLGRIDLKQLED